MRDGGLVIGVVGLIGISAGDVDAFNRQSPAGRFIDFGQRAAEAYIAGGDIERVGHVLRHELKDTVLAPAQDGVVWAGHAEVGDIGGAAGEDLGVGGGDVRVGADDEGG